jgi:hypothetical protein
MQVLSGYFFFLRICDTPPAVVTLKKPESRGWWPRELLHGLCVLEAVQTSWCRTWGFKYLG